MLASCAPNAAEKTAAEKSCTVAANEKMGTTRRIGCLLSELGLGHRVPRRQPIGRKVYREGRAAPRRALDREAAAVLIHDLLGDQETEAHAHACAFGGEAGLEDALQVFGRDAGAR